jgi:hypothetical protein
VQERDAELHVLAEEYSARFVITTKLTIQMRLKIEALAG